MWHYGHALDALYETPAVTARPKDPKEHRGLAANLIESVRRVKRTLLTEVESKELLAAYGIPVVETRAARTEDEAAAMAAQLGGPAVLKVFSHTITHKSDGGGVKLNLHGGAAVREAFREIEKASAERYGAGEFLGVSVQPMIAPGGYELILGSSTDPQFGPVLLFGSGGQLVEIFQDRALGLPPLNATLARRMMEQTQIFKAFKGVRGRAPVDLAALEELLVRFSHLVVEQRWIKEIDINPLVATGGALLALDARVVLHGAEVNEADLPRQAIRPYPTQYVSSWKLREGAPVTMRPIRPEDEPLMIAFHGALSEKSVHLRYFEAMKLEQRIAHARLRRICFNDYDREIALVVERRTHGTSEILGVGRLSKLHGLNDSEFAIVVADQWQGQGLGTRLLELLVQIGREEKLGRIIGHILPSNTTMRSVARKVGFELRPDSEGEEWLAEIAF